MFVYGNHLSGVITFLRTTKALSRRGKGGNSSFHSSKRFFCGGKTVDTTRQIIDTEKKTYNSLQHYQLNCSEKVRNVTKNQIKFAGRKTWYPASSLVCCTLLLRA